MEQNLALDPSSPLLDHCPAALPARVYYDADHFERERKSIWVRNWVYAGRINDVAPMTVRRLAVAGQNLILVKDADGALTCFHNTCRHRGAELCRAEETRLKSKLISCPYHGWSYDLRGKLVRTPFVSVRGDFRNEEHGLFPARLREWNGFIFVCLAEDPPPFAAAPNPGPNALDNWPMAELVTGHTMVKEIACNWKVFWDNYNECLHCPGIHPELCDMVPVYGRGYMAANEEPQWSPGAAAPVLKSGARTWTLNGQACGAEFTGLSPQQRAAGHTFVTLLPSLYIVAHVDYVRAVSLRPLAPERTELRAEWLFPAATLKAPGFDLDNIIKFASLVMAQDGAACEMNQRGLRSTKFEHGRLMPQEFDVFRFQQWVRRHLDRGGGEPS
jgi:glycine betaine catabolism A